MHSLTEASEFNVQLSHLNLRGLVWGAASAEPIIALHGWLDNSASFFGLAPLLSGYQVIAPDLVGHGLSDHRPQGVPYYVWDNVADILALVDHLKIDRFHLLGHSMGAGISSLLAAIAPERVLSVTLLDGLVPVTTPASQGPQQMAMSLRQRQRIAERPLRYYATFQQAVLVRSKSPYPVNLKAAEALVSRALSETDKGWRWHTDPYLFAPSVLRLTEDQVAEFLSQIDCSVLLCLAEKGIATPQIYPLAQRVRNITIKTMAGGHHFHLEDHALEEMAETILCHLNHTTSYRQQNNNSRIERV